MAARQAVYLDYAASTPLDADVARVMHEILVSPEATANPSSAHADGRAAASRAAAARSTLATAIGADPREIVWTSGATEADNLAVLGGARMQRARGRGSRVVTVATEHPAVLAACDRLEADGFAVTRLSPARDGALSPQSLASVLDDDVALVSVMAVNNETGVTQDIPALGECARAHGALMHIDAAQGGIDRAARLSDWPVDMVSLSAHKWHGPPGVGALWRRFQPRARLEPIVIGGGQESGLRGGTLALHQIAGMAEAYRLAHARRDADAAHMARLRQRLERGLAAIPGLVRNGRSDGASHILNVSVTGVHGDALRAALEPYVTVSAGSACSSREGEPSHVLRAMARPDALSGAALRISLGRDLGLRSLDEAVAAMGRVIDGLRAVSPAWRVQREGMAIADVYGMASSPELLS